MAGFAIEATNLAKRYGRRWALAGVSLQVREGSVLMVAGRNGSGKSTLFRLLATASRPDGGSGRVCGFDLVREREDVRRCSALMTHPSYLYEVLTARENLEVVAALSGLGGHEELLARVGLGDRAGDTVSTFSAGMRKRLMLARLLLQRPRIAFIDEPYGQLDPEGFSLVDQIVRELRDAGATVLLSTHQIARGTTLADDAVVLDGGRILWQGHPASIPGSTAG